MSSSNNPISMPMKALDSIGFKNIIDRYTGSKQQDVMSTSNLTDGSSLYARDLGYPISMAITEAEDPADYSGNDDQGTI